jgi:hypothetical protein
MARPKLKWQLTRSANWQLARAQQPLNAIDPLD